MVTHDHVNKSDNTCEHYYELYVFRICHSASVAFKSYGDIPLMLKHHLASHSGNLPVFREKPPTVLSSTHDVL